LVSIIARSQRRKQDGEHLLFGFLTTEANDTVRPIHAKAMPVILKHLRRPTSG
jgi:putative SOS response-associated peptidase YedK